MSIRDARKKRDDIISEKEISTVQGSADFGTMGKRQVVDQALLKNVCGYASGSQATRILVEHGLVSEGRLEITQKGQKYLWASFGHYQSHEAKG